MKTCVWKAVAAVLFAGVFLCGCALGRESAVQVKETQVATPSFLSPDRAKTQKETESALEEIEPFPRAVKKEKQPALKGGMRIVVISDLHYLAQSLTDLGEAFSEEMSYGDGKMTGYVWEILEAAIDDFRVLNPDVVLLVGDLSYNGERKSLKELAQKLTVLEDEGIEVLVIPGNHDINNPSAAEFIGETRIAVSPASPEDFVSIYRDFGYGDASSRDSLSLSYTYDLAPWIRLLALDTCQYRSGNRVGGMIQTSTYDWIKEELERAAADEVILLPVSHHNLLDESEIYVEDCTIEHSEEFIEMLDGQNIPLYLSGHLHVQHYMRSEGNRGIYEIVTSSLSTAPCLYGVLEYMQDGSFSYYTKQVDVEGWARREQSQDENLLNFATYGPQTLRGIFYNRACREIEAYGDTFSQEEKEEMAKVYASLCSAYCAGNAFALADDEQLDVGLSLWREYGYPPLLYEYLEYILRDAVKDYNVLKGK